MLEEPMIFDLTEVLRAKEFLGADNLGARSRSLFDQRQLAREIGL
jgi:hypothetical protein